MNYLKFYGTLDLNSFWRRSSGLSRKVSGNYSALQFRQHTMYKPHTAR